MHSASQTGRAHVADTSGARQRNCSCATGDTQRHNMQSTHGASPVHDASPVQQQRGRTRPSVRWRQFSDGHWEGEGHEEQRDGPPPPAGWGVVELSVCARRHAADDGVVANSGEEMPKTCGCKHSAPWENCGDACCASESPSLPPPCLVATAPLPIAQMLASGVDRRQGMARAWPMSHGQAPAWS